MSWDAYVQTQLLDSGCVSEGALLGVDGTLWAASSGLDIGTDYQATVTNEDGTTEEKTISEVVDIASYATTGQKPASGLRLGGQKFLAGRGTTDQDSGVLQYNIVTLGGGPAKKGGATICKTESAVIVGIWREAQGQNQADCGLTVFKLAAYLSENGM